MTEHPILFSGPMIRAILAGQKTVTRRVLKQAVGPSLSVEYEDGAAVLSWLVGPGPGHPVNENVVRVRCPYGVAGDRLWVRETWNVVRVEAAAGGGRDITPCPEIPKERPPHSHIFHAADGVEGPFRPSIHMPRWASRLSLDVAGVRVERLQDIDDKSIASEGVTVESVRALWSGVARHRQAETLKSFEEVLGPGGFALDEMPEIIDDCGPKHLWRIGWTLINGPESWAANPYVWVVSFRRVTT